AHVEIAEALRVALSPLERCEVLEPLQTVAEAAVPGAAGKAGDRRPEDTASHDGRQQRIGADVTITPVSVIAAEQLIAAVAAEHDLDVPARELCQVEHADGKRVGRLVEIPDHGRKTPRERRIDLQP